MIIKTFWFFFCCQKLNSKILQYEFRLSNSSDSLDNYITRLSGEAAIRKRRTSWPSPLIKRKICRLYLPTQPTFCPELRSSSINLFAFSIAFSFSFSFFFSFILFSFNVLRNSSEVKRSVVKMNKYWYCFVVLKIIVTKEPYSFFNMYMLLTYSCNKIFKRPYQLFPLTVQWSPTS